MVCLGYFGVYIIPKWLVKVPGHFAIFKKKIGNFEHLVKIWTRGPPNYYQNASTNTRKIWSHLGQILFMSIWDSKKRFVRKNVCPRYHIFCFLCSFSFCEIVSTYSLNNFVSNKTMREEYPITLR